MADIDRKTVSIVVPCYNEAGTLHQFLSALRSVAADLTACDFEFLFVDDGSVDDTESLLMQEMAADPRVRLLCLSRNFGHQRAITAGLDSCSGDYVVVMDADLQDPPALIPEMLALLDNGYDLVHTVRENRRTDTFLKRSTAHGFYTVMRRWVLPDMPENSADFKAFNRRVLTVFLQYRERVRFLRGLFATLGFKQTEVRYTRPLRCSGTSKYLPRKMLRLARDAFVSNTVLPLRLGLYLGALCLLTFPLYLLAAGYRYTTSDGPNEGLLLILIGLVWGFSGIILALLGALGEYVKCIILEVKQRPLYIVRASHNFPKDRFLE
jgi:dolichol-phosphate mannosyltransferase